MKKSKITFPSHDCLHFMKSGLIIAENLMPFVFEINSLQLVHVIYTLSDRNKLLKFSLVKLHMQIKSQLRESDQHAS